MSYSYTIDGMTRDSSNSLSELMEHNKEDSSVEKINTSKDEKDIMLNELKV